MSPRERLTICSSWRNCLEDIAKGVVGQQAGQDIGQLRTLSWSPRINVHDDAPIARQRRCALVREFEDEVCGLAPLHLRCDEGPPGEVIRELQRNRCFPATR